MLFVIFGYINEIDLSPNIIYKGNINNLQEKTLHIKTTNACNIWRWSIKAKKEH